MWSQCGFKNHLLGDVQPVSYPQQCCDAEPPVTSCIKKENLLQLRSELNLWVLLYILAPLTLYCVYLYNCIMNKKGYKLVTTPIRNSRVFCSYLTVYMLLPCLFNKIIPRVLIKNSELELDSACLFDGLM